MATYAALPVAMRGSSRQSPTPDEIRADRGELSQAAYAQLAGISRDGVAKAETDEIKFRTGTWRLLRATRALQRGDREGALAILAEGLSPAAAPAG